MKINSSSIIRRFIIASFLANTTLFAQQSLRGTLLNQAQSFGVDSLIAEYFRVKEIPIREHNQVSLLTSGKDKFADLLKHIEKAKISINMEYFNFRNDSISHLLFSRLGDKVNNGVEVKILFDAFGNTSNDSPLKNDYLDKIRSNGLQIMKYDPIRFPWVNHVLTRDHRKLVIIDHKVAYIGGMNVADYYINGLKRIGEWRDLHCRIEGDAVQDVESIFVDMWNREVNLPQRDSIIYETNKDRNQTNTKVAILDRAPVSRPTVARDFYTLSIEGASQRIRIENPYFVPTTSIYKAILKALKQGVLVEIMVPEKSDIPFTPDAMLHKLYKLYKKGAHVYLYRGGFLHAKMMTVDSTLSTLGSINLNSRSLRYDYEANAVFFDRDITAQLDSLYEADMKKCIRLDSLYWKKRSPWRKAVGWFANLLTPFL